MPSHRPNSLVYMSVRTRCTQPGCLSAFQPSRRSRFCPRPNHPSGQGSTAGGSTSHGTVSRRKPRQHLSAKPISSHATTSRSTTRTASRNLRYGQDCESQLVVLSGSAHVCRLYSDENSRVSPNSSRAPRALGTGRLCTNRPACAAHHARNADAPHRRRPRGPVSARGRRGISPPARAARKSRHLAWFELTLISGRLPKRNCVHSRLR